jgi:hypothetical protein
MGGGGGLRARAGEYVGLGEMGIYSGLRGSAS